MYADDPRNRHHNCFNNCSFNQVQNVLDEVSELSKGISQLSRAMWCDQKNHAFSERDPGKRHYTETSTDESGRSVTVVYDMCGECASQLARPALTTPSYATEDDSF